MKHRTDITDYTDHELVDAVKNGDAAAFNVIVQRYESKVIGVLFGMMHNPEDARDVAQDVFLKAYRSIDKFRGDSKLYTWLYRITVNMAIDFIRKKQKRHKVEYHDEMKVKEEEQGAVPVDKPGPSDTLQSRELYERLRQIVDTLPEEQKKAFMLREMEDLSYQEIAEVMQCSAGTVMSRLFYARKKIRDQLKPYMEGNE